MAGCARRAPPMRCATRRGGAKRIWASRSERPMTALVEARAIHTYSGSSRVLRGVDFHIERGETVGLLGRNGMGKTTLLRSLLGHLTPRRGEIRVRGTNMTGSPPEKIARQGVAYVPEGRGVFP